jgi:hypothetical protein
MCGARHCLTDAALEEIDIELAELQRACERPRASQELCQTLHAWMRRPSILQLLEPRRVQDQN